MSELKIKVTWDGMTIELEGETESVKEIFNPNSQVSYI